MKIKLSPLLADEVYAHTVETCLWDHRNNPNENCRLDSAEVSLYEKIETAGRNGFTLNITLDEAQVIYNDLYNLEDIVLGWAADETDSWGRRTGLRWYAVNKSITRHLAKLRAAGVETNDHGWAIREHAKVGA